MNNQDIIAKLKTDLAEVVHQRDWNSVAHKSDALGGYGNYCGETIKADVAAAYYNADADSLTKAIWLLETMNYGSK